MKMDLWQVVSIFTVFWSAVWIFTARFINDDIWPPRSRGEWLAFAGCVAGQVAFSTGVVYAAWWLK